MIRDTNFLISLLPREFLPQQLCSDLCAAIMFILRPPPCVPADKSRAPCELVLSLLCVRELLDQNSTATFPQRVFFFLSANVSEVINCTGDVLTAEGSILELSLSLRHTCIICISITVDVAALLTRADVSEGCCLLNGIKNRVHTWFMRSHKPWRAAAVHTKQEVSLHPVRASHLLQVTDTLSMHASA